MLTIPRYDGEDVEPEAAQPVAAVPKAEPEAPEAKAEPMNDATAPQQQQDDDDAKPFDPAAEEMDGMTGMANNAPHQSHQSYDTSEMDRTPVHMKDDG
jgi:hypothetical protein